MEQQKRLVRLSVEARSGTARFRVGVRAKSIRKALGTVGGGYPGGGVLFPIEPEGFFVGNPATVGGIAGAEQIHREAA